MSNIIAPFQMKKNKVVSYRIAQNEVMQEYENISVSLGTDYKITEIVENADTWNARLNLVISLIGTTNMDEQAFEICLDMMGIFEGDKTQLEQDKFCSMLKLNGISTLMQLSRAYITATTALSGFSSPIDFPMVNVFELIKSKEAKESRS